MTHKIEYIRKVYDAALAARTTLHNKSAWCKGAVARDYYGRSCPINDKNAVCWCIRGALHKATGYDVETVTTATELFSTYNMENDNLIERLNIPPNSIINYSILHIIFNDMESTTHEDIIQYLTEFLDYIWDYYLYDKNPAPHRQE